MKPNLELRPSTSAFEFGPLARKTESRDLISKFENRMPKIGNRRSSGSANTLERFVNEFPAARPGVIDAAEEDHGPLGRLVQLPLTANEMALLQLGLFAAAVDHGAVLEFTIDEFIAVKGDELTCEFLCFVGCHGRAWNLKLGTGA
jgi:hypothetical protein